MGWRAVYTKSPCAHRPDSNPKRGRGASPTLGLVWPNRPRSCSWCPLNQTNPGTTRPGIELDRSPGQTAKKQSIYLLFWFLGAGTLLSEGAGHDHETVRWFPSPDAAA